MITIKCAALRFFSTDIVVSAPPPNRHNFMINYLDDGRRHPLPPCEQGFLLSTGEFVNRKVALKFAREADQLIRQPTGGMLTTEDLW